MYERIKELAEAKGISVKALERQTGLANGTISKWNGNRGPTIASLKPVAEYLGVTIDELIKEEG